MNQYRLHLLLFCLFLTPLFANAQSTNIDVLNYEIHVDTINYPAKSISGFTKVKFVALAPITSFPLTLWHFSIDSIKALNQPCNFSYDDTTITLAAVTPLNPGDTAEYTLYYHGNPKTDPTGWGGVYFTSQIMFNMGVGFGTTPHNLGKAWFPCQDNFIDRALYHFYITTDSVSKAFCNGTLVSSTVNANNSITWEWEMNNSIPTYLASVAVAHYYTFNRNYQNIPVQIACLPTDSNKVAGTFQHLDSVLSNYVQCYGPYPFAKVGFCLVPFSSGAMEHASSIHVGSVFIDGSLTYETLWAHELSHMWWGDEVTCETEGDMWLNEGFASYNERLTLEKLYGETIYRDEIRTNHRSVLQFTHAKDGAYLPLINIPHDVTYGSTVYDKGPDVVHTLRNYMGDSAFFAGCRYYLQHRSFGNANSYQLRDDLSTASGINMNRFFDDWVFTPGFPHFSIDSTVVIPGSSNHYSVYIRQRSRGNNHLYEMPVELTFSNGTTDTTITALSDSLTNIIQVNLPFVAEWISIDRYEKISDAISSNERKIYATGVASMPETGITLNVQNAGTDTTTIRVEHNFVAPDGFRNAHPGIRLSDYHYWKIDGIFSSGFQTKATLLYNGTLSQNAGYLDNTLITGSEDSLVLYYRTGTNDDWNQVIGYVLQKSGSAFDKTGSFIIDTLKRGEYCFGYHDFTTSVNAYADQSNSLLSVYPNPSSDTFTVSVPSKKNTNYQLKIRDINGRILFEGSYLGGTEFVWKPTITRGAMFFISIYEHQKLIETKKVSYIR